VGPNLFIVGAPKCGTTAWVEYLRTHPDIFFPESKDDCYFGYDLPRFRLVRTETEYAKLFAGSGHATVIGEASAMYLFSSAAANAIRDFNPAAKILIFLRDQEDYLPSLHNQFLREFAEEIEDFELAWKLSGRRPPETIPATCLEPRTLDYAAMGCFCEQVGRYLDAFPAEQICVLRFRDWTTDPRAAYLELLHFLGLQDDGREDFRGVNQGTTYRSRALARFVTNPPAPLQRGWRSVKKVAGPAGGWLYRIVRTVGLRSTTGYKSEIRPGLRDEIRRYYADDNQQLEERLQNVPSAAPKWHRLGDSADLVRNSVPNSKRLLM
jgi:hypothetical protein